MADRILVLSGKVDYSGEELRQAFRDSANNPKKANDLIELFDGLNRIVSARYGPDTKIRFVNNDITIGREKSPGRFFALYVGEDQKPVGGIVVEFIGNMMLRNFEYVSGRDARLSTYMDEPSLHTLQESNDVSVPSTHSRRSTAEVRSDVPMARSLLSGQGHAGHVEENGTRAAGGSAQSA